MVVEVAAPVAAEALMGVRVAVLVWDVFRVRSLFVIGVAVARVLASQAGRSRVTVAFTEWPSSDCAACRRAVGVACVRRLGGRAAFGGSPTIRVPNLAIADDSRAYGVVGVPRRPLGPGAGFGFTMGFCKVTLSAPQYEKLILLLRSESSEYPASSSSSGSGTTFGWGTPE